MQKTRLPILIVDAPEKNADLLYASDFWAPDALVFLSEARKQHLLVSSLEHGRALRKAAERPRGKAMKEWTSDSLALRGEKRRKMSDWCLALLRKLEIRRVQIPPTFPHGIAQHLKRAGIQLVLAKGPLFPARQVKNPKEIALIEQSQLAATEAMKLAVRLIRRCGIGPGTELKSARNRRLHSEDVQTAIQEKLLAHGTLCKDVIVAGGRQAADPHERGHGPLRAGETIVIDIFPQHLRHGYWGDLTRTVVKGKATGRQRKMYSAVRDAHRQAMKAIFPRVSGSTVHQQVCEALKSRGFDTELTKEGPVGFIHSTGHGLGLEIHELPGLGASTERLKLGNVVTVEPGLYYPEDGGVRVEDTVRVTAGGARVLVACPHVFEV